MEEGGKNLIVKVKEKKERVQVLTSRAAHMLLPVCNFSAADSYLLIREWLVYRRPPIKR